MHFPATDRGRQMRRCLESASLHPPQAALRRFPQEKDSFGALEGVKPVDRNTFGRRQCAVSNDLPLLLLPAAALPARMKDFSKFFRQSPAWGQGIKRELCRSAVVVGGLPRMPHQRQRKAALKQVVLLRALPGGRCDGFAQADGSWQKPFSCGFPKGVILFCRKRITPFGRSPPQALRRGGFPAPGLQKIASFGASSSARWGESIEGAPLQGRMRRWRKTKRDAPEAHLFFAFSIWTVMTRRGTSWGKHDFKESLLLCHLYHSNMH